MRCELHSESDRTGAKAALQKRMAAGCSSFCGVPDSAIHHQLPSLCQQRQVFQALESGAGRSSLTHTLSVNVAPSTLEWQGMGCSYNTPTGTKEVLADVWGIAQPGEMQALLGPSGAGKSTFMDILALRKSVGNLSGRLLVNGQRANKKFIKKTAYVPQEDNFVPTMTTWEVMSFYADVSDACRCLDAANGRRSTRE